MRSCNTYKKKRTGDAIFRETCLGSSILSRIEFIYHYVKRGGPISYVAQSRLAISPMILG